MSCKYIDTVMGSEDFGRFSDYGLRFLVMVSDKAQDRYWALQFWNKYGLEATMEAFKIKRRTLYHWRNELQKGGENPESLNDQSTAPRKRRKRLWPREGHRGDLATDPGAKVRLQID
jgi:hypothetical protein